jgi:hypothetical protein
MSFISALYQNGAFFSFFLEENVFSILLGVFIVIFGGKEDVSADWSFKRSSDAD